MWKLGKIAGIDVSLHWTLLLLIAITGLQAPAGGAIAASSLIAAVFGCVLLHEFGHSMAARQFGIETSSIVLLPIGGIASLERMPRKPLQELWIAVAGPLVNVVIATGLGLLLWTGTIAALAPSYVGWLQMLMFYNMVLVAFNLLPAFPMDGGRVLRACLAMRLPYVTATNTAASLGKVVAVMLGIFALMNGQLMLMLLAGFVFFAGSAEARMVRDEQAQQPWPAPFESVRGFAHANKKRFADASTFVARRTGETIQVIWDEQERRYRYASSM